MLLWFPRVEDLHCETRLTVAHSFARVCLFADRFAHDFLQYSCFDALFPCFGSRYVAKLHLDAVIFS